MYMYVYVYICIYIYIEIGFQPRHFRYSTTLCFCISFSGILTMKNEWHVFQSIEYGWCFLFAGLLVINMFFISIRDDHVIQENCGNPHENQPFSIGDFPIWIISIGQKNTNPLEKSKWFPDESMIGWFYGFTMVYFHCSVVFLVYIPWVIAQSLKCPRPIFFQRKNMSAVDNFLGMAVRISREKTWIEVFGTAALPNDYFQCGSSVSRADFLKI